MAKKSSIEKNKRRRKMAKSLAGRRARLKAIVNGQDQADGRAFRRHPEACRIAAQFGDVAHPQSLRGDRPSARPITASRRCRRIALRELGNKGLIPGPCEVELVREDRTWL